MIYNHNVVVLPLGGVSANTFKAVRSALALRIIVAKATR